MVKHTQAIQIRWQQPRNCLSVFDHFVGLALKGLSEYNEIRSFRFNLHSTSKAKYIVGSVDQEKKNHYLRL